MQPDAIGCDANGFQVLIPNVRGPIGDQEDHKKIPQEKIQIWRGAAFCSRWSTLQERRIRMRIHRKRTLQRLTLYVCPGTVFGTYHGWASCYLRIYFLSISICYIQLCYPKSRSLSGKLEVGGWKAYWKSHSKQESRHRSPSLSRCWKRRFRHPFISWTSVAGNWIHLRCKLL